MDRRLNLCLLFILLGVAGECAADEIRVAVATNFAGAMEALGARFQATSGHAVLLSSGSTGGHYAQIKNGAPFEAFFSADTERPRLLESEGVAVPGSRFLYAVGRVALWSKRPGYVDAGGKVLETGDFLHLAIANPDLAPYGAAAREVLAARGIWDRLQSRLVMGQDIGQAYSFVQTGNAELGATACACNEPDENANNAPAHKPMINRFRLSAHCSRSMPLREGTGRENEVARLPS